MRWTLGGSLAAAVLSATALRAQGPASTSEPASTAAQAAVRPDFQLSLGGGASYENNARFAAVAPEGDVTRLVQALLSATAVLGRTAMTLSGSGMLVSHQKFHDMDQASYNFDGTLARTLSPRTAVNAALQAATSLSPVLDSGATGLTLGPLTTTHSQTLTAGIARRMSPRTSGTLQADVRRMQYGAATLVGGSEAGFSAGLQHRLAPTTGFGLDLAASQTSYAETSVLTQTLTGSLSGRLGAFAWTFGAGVRALETDSIRTPEPHLVAQANVGRRLGRFGAEVRGGYSIDPTLGVGTVLSTRFLGASIDRTSPTGTSVRLSVDQAVSHAETPIEAELPTAASGLNSLSVSANLQQALGLKTWIAAGATVRRSSGVTLVGNHAVTLSFGRQLF